MAAKSDIGAPAALRRLEEHELQCAQQVDKLEAELSRLRATQEPEGDDAIRTHRQRIQDAVSNLTTSQDDWNRALKSLREFDKAVSPAARDGVKIPQAEVERVLVQTWRFQRLGREAFIVAIAQDAIRCKDEADFYGKYADGIRECETNALRNALEHEKIAPFVAECFERSL